RREGCRLVYEPGSVVYHKATRSSGGHKFNEITAYYGYRNKIIFIRDAFGLYVLLLLMPFYAACFLRDIAKTVLFYDRKKILIRAMMKGFIDGARYILR
ncbi:MAG: hypothetical protein KKB12_03030, partial [Candidatus Omnitrophica bacterium]|nr:hypothetical protein [Candidatus Omnitrophota bacterium]